MTRFNIARFLAAAALVGAALGLASTAQAGTSVQVSIGLPFPTVHIDGPRIFVPPPHVVLPPPRMVYREPPVIVVQRPPLHWQDTRHGRYVERRDWRHEAWRRHQFDRRDHNNRDDRHDRGDRDDRDNRDGDRPRHHGRQGN